MAKLTIPARGWWVAGDPVAMPPGALAVADEVTFVEPGVAEPRWSFIDSGSTWSENSDATAIFAWKDGAELAALVHRGTVLGYEPLGTPGYVNYSGSYAAEDARLRFAEAKECLYFTSNAGVYRLDAYDGTPVVSGLPKPLGISCAAGAGSPDFLTAPASVAYRAVFKLTDAKGNVYFSAPSSRGIYRLAASTDTVAVTVTFSTSLSTSYALQLYRSEAIGNDGSADGDAEPSDEMGLVYERFLTSGEVSAGSATITDVVPDDMRGATGYFCPSQEGIAQANERPPIASDVCWHKDTLFYSNTTTKHRLFLRLLNTAAAGSDTALVADDTVTIAGQAYTAKASPSGSTEFQLYTSGTQQVNVQQTCLSLVAKINANASNTTVDAYYLSGPDDAAGLMLIEERGLGGSSFAAISSEDECWVPALPSSGTTASSTNEERPNRVYFSKPGQPEAVPLLNYFDVGSQAEPIARIMSLRDALYVFKTNEGIFRVVGSNPGFAPVEHDSTVNIIGRDTAARLGNEILCFSDKGVVAVSDVGCRVLSGPIAPELLWWIIRSDERAAAHDFGHAAGREDQELYVLWLPVGDDDANFEAYVYSKRADAWSFWDIDARCSSWGLSTASSSRRTLRVALDNGRTLQAQAPGWVDQSGAAVKPSVTWQKQFAGDPETFKQWTGVNFLVRSAGASSVTLSDAAANVDATLGFSTDQTGAEQTATVTAYSTAHSIPAPIPTAMQLSTYIKPRFTATTANSTQRRLRITGVVLTYEEGGDNAGR